jgi:hypothetical protein
LPFKCDLQRYNTANATKTFLDKVRKKKEARAKAAAKAAKADGGGDAGEESGDKESGEESGEKGDGDGDGEEGKEGKGGKKKKEPANVMHFPKKDTAKAAQLGKLRDHGGALHVESS